MIGSEAAQEMRLGESVWHLAIHRFDTVAAGTRMGEHHFFKDSEEAQTPPLQTVAMEPCWHRNELGPFACDVEAFVSNRLVHLFPARDYNVHSILKLRHLWERSVVTWLGWGCGESALSLSRL